MVKRTTQIAKLASTPMARLVALLASLPRRQGSGRPASRRALAVPGLVAASLVVLAVTASPSLAAAPEAPETEPAIEVSNTTAVLQGILNPNNEATDGWYFAYKAGPECTGGSVTQLEHEESVRDEEVRAEVTGLQPGAHYTFCLVARNAQEEITTGSPVAFTTTTAAASVDDEYASEAGPTSAQLNAKLNVRGSAASYHFEYGLTPTFGTSTPEQALAPAHSDVLGLAPIAGLSPYTRYYARVVAESEFGTSDGATFTFLTLSNNSASMPDGRVYEMVTPVQNDDADIYAPGNYVFARFGALGMDIGSPSPFQVSEDGEAVTYVGDPVVGGNGSGGASPHAGNQFFARHTSTGWQQEVIAATGRNHSYYEAFSPELSAGILRAGNGYGEDSALLSEAEALNGGYHVLYERNDATRGLGALFTHFDTTEPPGPYEFLPQFAGGSRDFSTMVFDANAPLIPGAAAGRSVYESVNGRLSLANVLPDGSIEPEAQAGAAEEPGLYEEGSPEFSHDVSSDGSRVFWTGLGTHPNLYMREDGGRTVQLDSSQAGGPGGGGKFWTASDNGERVFFTDEATAALTADTPPGSGANLYEYDVASGELTDLTPSAEAGVQGVIGASEDGSYVYFVADGVLAEGASAGGCVVEPDGSPAKCNLYVAHDGVVRFIAQLSQTDGMAGGGNENNGGFGLHGDWREGPGRRTAQVSADGMLVFDSELSLTGYRNDGAEEVYVFSPASGAGGQLDCASCRPSEEPATGVGGIIPVSNNATETSRAVSTDGTRVFFDSNQSLLPQDVNGRLDVYEWERDGSGTCELPTNCVSLLSGGTALSNSYLLGTSASGDDVMIITRAQLVGADRNENYDVYDARVDGEQSPAPPVCSGTGCQGAPPAPPIFATPASATFAGVGDFPSSAPTAVKPKKLTRAQKLAAALRRCQKEPGKRRNACIREARRRYGTKSERAKRVKRTANKTKQSAKKGGK
jgi:hypothetical protein